LDRWRARAYRSAAKRLPENRSELLISKVGDEGKARCVHPAAMVGSKSSFSTALRFMLDIGAESESIGPQQAKALRVE